ncbi:MAG TPA: hypothetical protein VF723_16145 [Pyrinomonadaceae bacterium]|jgi:hypothetical protein
MSYHVLHHFDEQWLAELKHTDAGNAGAGFLRALDEQGKSSRRARLGAQRTRQWGFVVAALTMAALALLFAHEATRRADDLQQRLQILELKTARK